MCRSGSNGQSGRRCPSHSDAKAVEARNARRRELRSAKNLRTALVSNLQASQIPFVRGDEAPTMYYIGTTDFDRTKMQPVQDERDQGSSRISRGKPDSGGIWLSRGEANEEGSISTEWSRATQTDLFNAPYSRDTYAQEIKTMPDAVILELNTPESFDRMYERYADEEGIISYEKMAEDGVDGLFLDPFAIQKPGDHLSYKTREEMSAPEEVKAHQRDAYRMWDVPSCLLVNPVFAQSKPGQPVEIIETQESSYSWNDSEDEEISFDAMQFEDEDDDKQSIMSKEQREQIEETLRSL